jgi:4-amino-4-deoxy-L-arabinose transferase-like glycosyltransferase
MLDTTVQERPAARAAAPAADGGAHSRRAAYLTWGAVAAITLLAGALRLYHLGHSPLNPFYDAAVRSMSQSWHNFFFGALEPGGSVSIDKPPIDLWLQVASTKIVGFNTTGLLLPEALIGTAAVPLLFAAVRRIWSTAAGLAAALALALLPIEVITSRSDTMDAVMMALTVLALLCIARAAQRGSTAWLLGAGAALGVAFDVKLSESLVALPGLVVFALLALPGSWRRRIGQLLMAGALYVAVALAWLLATLAFPAGQRPFAVGSTNGSAWNAALVFNGVDRLEGKPTPGQSTSTADPPGTPPPSRYGQLTLRQREEIPLRPPSATRLLDRAGALAGQRLGLLVLAALLLGIPAFAFQLRERRRRANAAREQQAAGNGHAAGLAPPPQRRHEPPPGEEQLAEGAPGSPRLRLAGLAGLLLWLVIGTVMFSQMAHLHPRYTESIAPAVAGTLGIGLAWACAQRTRARIAALAVCLIGLVLYAAHLLFGLPPAWWAMLAAALAALACALWAPARGRSWALVLALICLLVIPAWAAVRAVQQRVVDANQLGELPTAQLAALSGYLRAHQGSARYEVAYDTATKMGALVVHDGRPVVVLNSIESKVVTPLARLRALAAAGAVHYAVLSTPCGPHSTSKNADCTPAGRWVVANGKNVSAQAGLGHGLTLWRLPHSQAQGRPGA